MKSFLTVASVLLKRKKDLVGSVQDGPVRLTGAVDEVVRVSATQRLDVVVQGLG